MATESSWICSSTEKRRWRCSPKAAKIIVYNTTPTRINAKVGKQCFEFVGGDCTVPRYDTHTWQTTQLYCMWLIILTDMRTFKRASRLSYTVDRMTGSCETIREILGGVDVLQLLWFKNRKRKTDCKPKMLKQTRIPLLLHGCFVSLHVQYDAHDIFCIDPTVEGVISPLTLI